MIRCGVCHEPVLTDTKPVVCNICEMIAENRTFQNGKDPAEGLTPGEVSFIQVRVASIKRVQPVT